MFKKLAKKVHFTIIIRKKSYHKKKYIAKFDVTLKDFHFKFDKGFKMKVTQEKLPGSQIKLEIEISSETSKSTYEKIIKEFTRSAEIPGFRKGKVPRLILLQRLGSQRIKSAALEELINDRNSFLLRMKEAAMHSLHCDANGWSTTSTTPQATPTS